MENEAFDVVKIDPEAPGVYENLFVPETLEALRKRDSSLALGLERGELACGALGGFLEKDEEGRPYFLLSSLFIDPEHRGEGGGSLLFETLVLQLKEALEPAAYITAQFETPDEEMEQLYTFLLEEGMEDLDPDSEEGELVQEMIMLL
ncbi:MAG: GNAT family N-acetyltransferase [Lachnospiraceae bacterium]|nr:GNAT family N-acetyltransferase [Lachnospiraceae bacterium]